MILTTIAYTVLIYVCGYFTGQYLEKKETINALSEMMNDKKNEVSAIGFIEEE
jgi:hypothetical protein